nr:7907_t:CDS:2 [Entrophospora candida]CAG8529180.1 12347_t:CDS:2 [Entrophospora candida]
MSTHKTSSSKTSVNSSSYSSNDGVVYTTTTTTKTTKNQVDDGNIEVEITNESSSRDQVSYLKHDNESLPDDFNFFVKPNQSVDYKLSDCSGKKKSLLIGINYYNTSYTLKGCINDVQNIKKFIINTYGFSESNMLILTDDQLDPSKIPTRENLLNAMKWLVSGAQKDDSGHGGQLADSTGDEEDGFDETIMPVDFQTKGQIIDDEMHHILVESLPLGVRLTVVFDCCHSGTVLDLPYVYSTRGVIKRPNSFKKNVFSVGIKYLHGEVEGLKSTLSNAFSSSKIRRKNIATKASPADVIMFSGCKDEQTSADAHEAGQATGAMSHALVKSLTQNPHPTYKELLISIRDILKAKYAQKPQLSASHEMNMNDVFKM